jgi:hypothetical protein
VLNGVPCVSHILEQQLASLPDEDMTVTKVEASTKPDEPPPIQSGFLFG